MDEIGKVISSNPGTIHILLNSIDDFERNKSKIKIYLKEILKNKMRCLNC